MLELPRSFTRERFRCRSVCHRKTKRAFGASAEAGEGGEREELQQLAEAQSAEAIRQLAEREEKQAARVASLEYAIDSLEEAESAEKEARAARLLLSGARKTLDRLESTKAAASGLLASLVVALPGAAASPHGLSAITVSTLIQLASSGAVGSLLAVLYRYAVRTDDDPQLKLGAAGGIGLARAIGEASATLKQCGVLSQNCIGEAALSAGECMLSATAAGVTVEALMYSRNIARCGTTESNATTAASATPSSTSE
jgi:hypothetical protein